MPRIIYPMVRNNAQQQIPKLSQRDRETILNEYQRVYRRGLLSKIATELHVDRATITRAFNGITKKPNPKILDAIWREIQTLTCREEESGVCPECPLRSACERLAAGLASKRGTRKPHGGASR